MVYQPLLSCDSAFGFLVDDRVDNPVELVGHHRGMAAGQKAKETRTGVLD
jgi:hypothetical protein